MATFEIAGRNIGVGYSPFIIAEMSGNHNQSLDRALEIVDAAAKSGVDAIKLQTYTPDTITMDISDPQFTVSKDSPLWSGKNLYSLYKDAYTPWEWHKEIISHAHKLGLICFSSPFDETAVDFLDSLDVPAFKIASFENNHLPLIAKAASTGKPLIISTGMATIAELDEAVSAARDNGCTQLALLKCTSTYPASPIHTNISTIPHLKQLFNAEVGISDHTAGIGVSIASIALGASIIEKHLTLSKSDGGVDSAFSMEPSEFTSLVTESRRAWEAIGKIFYGPTSSEHASLIYRRSIYVSKDINKGDLFSSENLKIIRPGDGAPPSLYKTILGCKAPQTYKQGTPLKLNELI